MRFTKYIMLVALFFITNCVGISAASAVNSGFTNQIIHDADERSRLLSGFDLVKIDHEYRGPCSICSYDVSAEGQIAVAFSPINVHNRRINVYDQKGIFLYSLKFSDYGGFQIEYDQLDNQLMIHLSRSKLLLKIDESGVVVDLAQVYSSKVNSSYAIELDVLTELDRNGNKYVRSGILPDNMIGSMINYTKISIIYPRGDSRIVFDNTLLHLASILIPLLLLPLILCAFLLLVYALIKNAGVMNRTDKGPSPNTPTDMSHVLDQKQYVSKGQAPSISGQLVASIVNVISGGFFVSSLLGILALRYVFNARKANGHESAMLLLKKSRNFNRAGFIMIGVELLAIITFSLIKILS